MGRKYKFVTVFVLAVAAGVFFKLRHKPQPVVAHTTNEPRPDQSGAELRPDFMFPVGSPSGVIEGSVFDDQGRPVAGAVVSIGPRLIGTKGYRERIKDSTPTAVRTDAKGHYRAENVRPGVLAVVATAPHFLPARVQPVKLMPDASLVGIDLKLTAGGVRLYGSVTDTGGGPVPGALITAAGFEPAQEPGSEDASVLVITGIADDNGQFELYAKPLYHDVRVSASGYAPQDNWLDLHQETRHDVKLHPAAHIRGVVRDENQHPIADAKVRIVLNAGYMTINGSYDAGEPIVTDAEGNYSSPPLDPGRYTVSARAGALAVRAKEPVDVGLAAQVKLDLILSQGLVIGGRVTDSAGKPIAGATLSTEPMEWFSDAKPPVDATTDKDGRYTIKGLLGPMVSLKVQAKGFGTKTRLEQQLLKDKADVDFKLAAEGSLLVTALGPNQQPLKGIFVNVQIEPETPLEPGDFMVAEKPTGDDGTARIKALPSGKIRVNAHAMDHGGRSVADVAIEAGKETAVTVHFDATGTIEGTVSWSDGSSAEGVHVNAWGKAGGSDATAAKNGTFVIKNLAAGSYTVVAFKMQGNVVVFNEKPSAKAMSIVDLKANERHDGVKLVLEKQNETIEGVVYGPDGLPAVAAQVGATGNNNAKYGGCDVAYGGKVISDAQGRFKIEGLSQGTYGVCATQAGHPNAVVANITSGTKNVTIKLAAPARISGVVVDAAGKPVTPCEVAATFRQPEEADVAFAPWKSAPASTQVSDASGSFTLSSLAPGVWDVLATAPDGRHGIVRRVQLASGAKTTIRIQMNDGISVVGRLVNAETQAPLAGVTIRTRTARTSATTDADGRFKLTGVEPGMKVGMAFEPNDKKMLPDFIEAWIPEASTSFDIGTMALAPSEGPVEEEWGKQAAAASAGLRVRNEGGHAVVTGIFEESPAAKTEVKVRDRVLAINGKPIDNLGMNAISRLLTGEPGKSVMVRVQTADGQPRDVNINLAKF